jgi:hypothetical protein
MNQSQNNVADPAQRAEIEAALADYPHLSEDRLAGVIRWYRKEASAFDVAMLASNEAIAEPYRRFRADHIDPLTGKDVMKGLLLAALAGLAVFLIIWWVA